MQSFIPLVVTVVFGSSCLGTGARPGAEAARAPTPPVIGLAPAVDELENFGRVDQLDHLQKAASLPPGPFFRCLPCRAELRGAFLRLPMARSTHSFTGADGCLQLDVTRELLAALMAGVPSGCFGPRIRFEGGPTGLLPSGKKL